MNSINDNTNDTKNVENDEKDNSTNTTVDVYPFLSSTAMKMFARVVKAVHHSLIHKKSLTMILDSDATHNISGNNNFSLNLNPYHLDSNV